MYIFFVRKITNRNFILVPHIYLIRVPMNINILKFLLNNGCQQFSYIQAKKHRSKGEGEREGLFGKGKKAFYLFSN